MDEHSDHTSKAPPPARLSRLSRSVAGHVVLVTGAGSGIGRATAHLFADEGAIVAVTDRDAGRVADVVAEIEGVGGRARGWTLDVADRA
ncbi:MAG: SDR family NAD(P)-dependent oxidoreductase, partial [Actinomycetota bacterium]|nr:SDR family NAD(P)-dependent oxidoreductase [Actinomycetota bacterium]